MINLEDIFKDQYKSTLFNVAMAAKPKKILELGVREGVSTFSFLTACSLLDATLISVDKDDNLKFNCPEDFKKHWTYIRSDSISYLEQNQTKFDLIYVDDWHESGHVTNEINLISNICDKNTIIMMHDTMHSGSFPNYNLSENGGEFANGGPYRALSRLDKNIWEYFTFPFEHGITLLRKYS